MQKSRQGRVFVTLLSVAQRHASTVNPRNNLAHCFRCHKNLNNIDLLILLGHDFLSATAFLEQWLTRYDANRKSRTNSPTAQK